MLATSKTRIAALDEGRKMSPPSGKSKQIELMMFASAIELVFLIVLAAIWSATQWTAWPLGFQPQLGLPWCELVGMPVYVPPALFWWWYRFEAYAPAIFVEGGVIAASGGFAAIGMSIGLSVSRARERDGVTTYGSARWASKHEVQGSHHGRDRFLQ
jgi:type IV secretion system protein VirD4